MNELGNNLEIVITPAFKKDLESILALQKYAYLSEAEIINNYEIPPLTQTLDDIQKEYKHYLFLKAVSGNTIIGSVRAKVTGDTCYIGRLIVHPEYQNQGIGSLLLVNIEAAFPGVSRFELFTGEKSVNNHQFYSKRGYQAIRTEKIDEKLSFVYYEKQASG